MAGLLSRRHLLQSMVAGAAVMNTRSGVAESIMSLGTIAAMNGYLFGAAAGSAIDNDPAYRALYVAQPKIITTEVALKIGTIAPWPGPKNYQPADRLLNFCNHHAIPMRGHCLIWNEWVPAWVKVMSANERRTYFDSYIEEVVARYAGQLQSWDIVNEPFWPGHHARGDFRVGPWYDAFGPDYVRRAFERAARVDGTAKFVLNEAQTERDDELGLAMRRGLLKLVADLKHAGVRLDIVGLQGHLQPEYPHDPGRFGEFLHELAALGVDIYITEFDVRDDTFPDEIQTRDKSVARLARQFLDTALRQPAVKAVITWELADNYSFYTPIWQQRHPMSGRLPRPLPYDDEMHRKPMWFGLAQAFETTHRSRPYTNGGAR